MYFDVNEQLRTALDKYGRVWNGPFSYNLDEINRVAKSTIGMRSGVYQILFMREPVYIGVSSRSVFGRLRSHARGTGNKHAGKRAGAALYEFVFWQCDGKGALGIESHILRNNPPGFNGKVEWAHFMDSIYMH